MPPALTDSIRGKVLDNLCVALRAMTVAAGYHWDVAATSVQTDPVNVLGVPASRRPFFLVEPSPDSRRVYEPANQLEETFHVLITAVVDAEEDGGPDRKVAAGEALAMDLEKALTVDIERGGFCHDTRLDAPRIIAGLGTDGTVAVEQPLRCPLHRDYGSP